MGDIGRFAVRFEDEALAEDLAHATEAARSVAEQARRRLEREGIAPAELWPCMAEGPDGTRLAGCVKTYLPPPDGRWGMVFRGGLVERRPALVCIAFGVRHADQPWQPSVYQVADRRLRARGR